MKILVVEDEFISREMMFDMMSAYGKVETAEDGAIAVRKFKYALEAGEPFNLVTLDIMLPEQDGQSVLKSIRELENQHGVKGLEGVKIIMTSALGDYKNISTAFTSQCEAYLVKPVDPDLLAKTITELMNSPV